MRFTVFLVLLVLQSGCATLPEQKEATYQLARMRHLQTLQNWYFEGRVAMVGIKDSVTASISWRHQTVHDVIELSGPLAQGRIIISVSPESVIVDDGDKREVYQGQVDSVVSEQLGLEMPVNALKFWVLGVNDPEQSITEMEDGFMQAGWRVKFNELQVVNAEQLPKKISAMKDRAQVKLVIDHWDIL